MQAFMQQLTEFLTRHWLLAALFVLLFIFLVIEEARSKGFGKAGVSAQQLVQDINKDEAVVLDIRDKNLFKSGHIIGSVRLREEAIADNFNKLAVYKQKLVVVVDANGQKSGAVVEKLCKAGFEAKLLTGGLQAWQAAGLPLASKKNNK